MNEPGRCYCHDPPTVHFKRLHRKRKEAPSAPEGCCDGQPAVKEPTAAEWASAKKGRDF